jgi:hypothetical protein
MHDFQRRNSQRLGRPARHSLEFVEGFSSPFLLRTANRAGFFVEMSKAKSTFGRALLLLVIAFNVNSPPIALCGIE